MIGLVLISHGRLAEELRRSLEAIAGVQPNFGTVCVGPDDNPEERRTALAHAIAQADEGAGVIVVADLYGATPCNIALALAGWPAGAQAGATRREVDVIAGANLPMLVELAAARHCAGLPECVARGTAAGRHDIAAAPKMPACIGVQASGRLLNQAEQLH